MPRPLLENAMTFEIDKTQPIPKNTKGRPRIYPFMEMEVGDSFVVPLTDELLCGENRNARLLRSAATAYTRKFGGKFTVRIERAKNVTRCWRVE